MALPLISKNHSLKDKFLAVGLVIIAISLVLSLIYSVNLYRQNKSLTEALAKNTATIQEIGKELEDIKSNDPYKTNQDLKKQIDLVQKTFNQSVSVYEDLLDFENPPKNIKALDDLYANVLTALSKSDYAGANEILNDIAKKITEEEAKIAAAAAAAIPKNLPATNTAPAAGASSQLVQSDAGSFRVDIVAGDLSTTKVIVDTASDSTCTNNCPVMSLASYVSRNGAYAGVNGSYFCPASYPSCAGKTNSFDTLLMNVRKTYFNSDNNVYSNNPAVIFGGSYIRFVGASKDWGRDTGIDSMISNYPLLVSGGNVAFGGGSDPKQGSKGSRSFVANKGQTVYIGVVHNATVAEAALVMKSMGMENALNLDSGGSTALWNGGYKVGPGRDIPNAILFVKK